MARFPPPLAALLLLTPLGLTAKKEEASGRKAAENASAIAVLRGDLEALRRAVAESSRLLRGSAEKLRKLPSPSQRARGALEESLRDLEAQPKPGLLQEGLIPRLESAEKAAGLAIGKLDGLKPACAPGPSGLKEGLGAQISLTAAFAQTQGAKEQAAAAAERGNRRYAQAIAAARGASSEEGAALQRQQGELLPSLTTVDKRLAKALQGKSLLGGKFMALVSAGDCRRPAPAAAPSPATAGRRPSTEELLAAGWRLPHPSTQGQGSAPGYGASPARSWDATHPSRNPVSPPAVPSPSGPGPEPTLGGSDTGAALESFQKRLFGDSFPLLSRLDWGAARSRGSSRDRKPERITVHHTVGAQTFTREDTIRAVRGIQSYHQNTRGWGDIGYHFLVDGAGRMVEARPVGILGAHTLRNNSGNVGIALMGNFEERRPSEPQFEGLRRLAAFLALRHGISPGSALHGHRHYVATACPGRQVWDALPRLRTEIAALISSWSRGPALASGFTPVAVLSGG